MRKYFSETNLKKAATLSAAVSVLALPRILLGGVDPWTHLIAMFAGMTFVSGSATAWSAEAGMSGLFPGKKRLLIGAGIAVVLACVLFFPAARLDHVVRSVAAAKLDGEQMKLLFPDSRPGILALVAWTSGFETVFFQAAALSFFARLTRRQWIAVVSAVLLRLFVEWKQLAYLNLPELLLIETVGTAIVSLCGCLLFAKAGLVPASVLSGLLAARRLLFTA